MRSIMIAQQIKTARERAGLSVVELAAKARVGINTLYKAEAGKTVPRRAVLKRLAQVIDIPTEVECRLVAGSRKRAA